MHAPASGFHYRNSELFADEVSVAELAETHGTPLYVYSGRKLRDNFGAIEAAFRDVPHLVCYALKANSNLSVLRELSRMGCGADIVSGGELQRALRAGIPASRIVFAGVGKLEDEIAEAIRRRILMLNIESAGELEQVSRIAGALRVDAGVSLRVNPDIDPGTHPYISTGLRKHKFGVPMSEARRLYRRAASLPRLVVRGIHMHLGSQISRPEPFVAALQRVLALIDEMAAAGISIRYLDMGGGMGIRYREPGEELAPAELAAPVRRLLEGRRLELILEPGRAIAGDAGILVTKVLQAKKSGTREFLIVDAGMNDLIRPSLYDAYHEILPVRRNRRARVTVDVVGPVCETGDFLARERSMAPARPGELLAVCNAGAYGWSMGSNYNSRPRAAEVLVDGPRASLAGRRETIRDLLKREIMR